MELIKRVYRWDLYNEDGHKIASTLDGCVNKLSLKNCQAIERGYDLDELAGEFTRDESYGKFSGDLYKGYIFGFQKALKLMGDKKFSEEDVMKFGDWLWRAEYKNVVVYFNNTTKELFEIWKSLQQTEWDVTFNPEELDADRCLILKCI